MLSISDPITNADEAVEYYIQYYGEGSLGQWFGAGAEYLGLPAQVNAETFRSLLKGYSPDGSRELVANAGAPDRTCGWDLTFSAPKPFSVLWAMLPTAEQKELAAIHREAVEVTLKLAEEMFGVIRRGKGGKIHQAAGLLFARFEEYTSRANDMAMHTHCVLINTGTSMVDGKTGALHGIKFFRAKMLLGAAYQAEVAALAQRRLNLIVTPEQVGFGIRGVPQEFCRAQSKRRVAIEKTMKARGLESAEAAKIAALDTRPQKQTVELEKLFPIWHAAARSFGWGPEQALQLFQARPQTHDTRMSFVEAAQTAVTQIKAEDRTSKNVLRAIKNAAIESGVGAAKLIGLLETTRLPDGERLWQSQDLKAKQHGTSVPKPRSQQPAQASSKAATTSPETESARTVVAAAKSKTNQPNYKAQDSSVVQPKSERTTRASPKPATPKQESKSPRTQAAAAQSETSQQHPGDATKKDRQEKSGPDNAKRGGPSQSRNTRANAGDSVHTAAADAQADARAEARRQRAAEKKARQLAREQRRRNRNFVRNFGAAVDHIFPEKQTRKRLTKLANRLAEIHKADTETLEHTLATMRPGAERSTIHVESPRLFPDSPLSPIKWWRVPKLVIGEKPRKWGDIIWKKNLPVGEIRLQKSRLCPRAPKWSPLHGIEIPALHFSLKRSTFKARQKEQKPQVATKAEADQKKHKVQKDETKQKDQSQSQ